MVMILKNLSMLQRKLPAFARVKQARNPCAYDNTQLKLEVLGHSLRNFYPTDLQFIHSVMNLNANS